jgi:hypothetical protein
MDGQHPVAWLQPGAVGQNRRLVHNADRDRLRHDQQQSEECHIRSPHPSWAAERRQEGTEESKTASPLTELGAELFFFVVRGLEDLAVLVEVVNQTFDGVGRGRSHV